MRKTLSAVLALALAGSLAALPAAAKDVRAGENLIEVCGFEYLADGTNLNNEKGFGQQYRLDYNFKQTDGFGLGPDGQYEAFIAAGKGYGGGKALKWLPHSTWPHSPLTIDLSADPKGVTDWTGVTEVWLYVDAGEFPETEIMFNFGLYLSEQALRQAPADDNVPDVVLNKFGAPIFVQNMTSDDTGDWKMQATTTWRRVTLPAGFAGWVRIPVNAAAMGILGKSVGDNFAALDFSHVAGLFLEMNFEWMGEWDNDNGIYIEKMPADNTRSVYIDAISIKADESKRTTVPTEGNTPSSAGTISPPESSAASAEPGSTAPEPASSEETVGADATTVGSQNTPASVPPSEEETGGPNWLVIGIVIGAVVLAGGAAAVFLILKNRKTPPPPEGPAE